MTVQLKNKRTDDGVFDNFPKSSDHRRQDERSRTFSENFRRLPKVFEKEPKTFRSDTNEFNYNLRDKLDVSEIDIYGKYANRVVNVVSIEFYE